MKAWLRPRWQGAWRLRVRRSRPCHTWFLKLRAITAAIEEMREERRESAAASVAQLRRLGDLVQAVHSDGQRLHAQGLELMASIMGRELSAEAARARESRAPPRARCNKCVACTISPPPAGCRRGPCESWRTARASDDGGGVRAPGTPRGPDGRFQAKAELPGAASPMPLASPGPGPALPSAVGSEESDKKDDKKRAKEQKKQKKEKKQKITEAPEEPLFKDPRPDRGNGDGSAGLLAF